ncbi:MAG TPA: Crp/Fnr family transcriptional regulator [Ottowia sp.]|uniref:Crp/Fnr family transcriptional regulator n=1 Tax=Ottowia sp. TaxID=1898956 RepID=UPI002BDFA2F2|nr:Crp/Fnr family transcriptional regulator [Ottowia sp.]HMN21605.1 Crp/Fnr family transcriptional regulator [Ottowia sp.]
MLPLPEATHRTVTLPAGAVLLRRGTHSDVIYHVGDGRLALGLLGREGLAHQLGWLEGPCWLDPGSAVLGLEPLMDVVTDSAVELQAVPLAEFSASLDALPSPTQSLLRDLARAHRQQAELAVSRLGKDAEARCAEWLLRQVEPITSAEVPPSLTLRERKRAIAAQLGIAPETFSRVLRQLRERRLISGKGRQLSLINIDGLRALAGA